MGTMFGSTEALTSMNIYSLGSPFGIEPCEALAKNKNFNLHKAGNESFKNDPIAVWGQLRGARDLLRKSKHFYRLDHAYMKRMDYFRMTRNDFQPSVVVERPADRWEVLKKKYAVKVSGWRKGSSVVIACSDPRTYDFFGVPDWPTLVQEQIRKKTDRPIIVRKRDEKIPLSEQLRDAHCLVTYASNSVVDALISGIPVFALGPSIARPMGFSDLALIEAPFYPENREEFFNHMAYSQFTKDEFASGFALRTADETWDTATNFWRVE